MPARPLSNALRRAPDAMHLIEETVERGGYLPISKGGSRGCLALLNEAVRRLHAKRVEIDGKHFKPVRAA